MKHIPFLIVISAPSGTGKTTVVRGVLDILEGLFYSVSATTRKRREGEVDGKDYIFIDRKTFEKWKENELIEWAEVYGEYYGTPRTPIEEALRDGKDVILDLDVNGKRALEKIYKERVVSIFLLPPDLETLKERLTKRGVEEPSKLKIRMDLAREEISWAHEYDYWVINKNLEDAIEDVVTIIKAERMKRKRLEPYFPFKDR